MLHRLFLTLVNIFFPPLAVCLLTGPYTDTLINCILFLCGVLPSHIHGFYISCTYFHRKRKVRKGKWPGGPKLGIYDSKIWWGGAKEGEVEALRTGARKNEKYDPRVNAGLESQGSRRGYPTNVVMGNGSTNEGVQRVASGRRRVSQYGGAQGYPHQAGSGYDRRSQPGVEVYGGHNQNGQGVDRRRSVMGEMGRRY